MVMAAAAGTTAPGSAGTGTLGAGLALAPPTLLHAPHTLTATAPAGPGLTGTGSAAPGLPGPRPAAAATVERLTAPASGTSRTGTLGTRLALASSTLLDTTGAAPAAGPGLTAPASAPAGATGQQSKIIFIMFMRHFQKINRDSFCL